MGKYNEDVKFEYDEDCNIKSMKIIHYTDHGNPAKHPNPHVHDIDVKHDVFDANGAYGKARDLKDDD